MIRQTKYLLVAIAAAFSAWLLGLYLIGIAIVRDFTASGQVDMSDAHQISKALTDPTFTTTYSWGNITLQGWHWATTIPFGSAALFFIAVIVVARIRSRRHPRPI